MLISDTLFIFHFFSNKVEYQRELHIVEIRNCHSILGQLNYLNIDDSIHIFYFPIFVTRK